MTTTRTQSSAGTAAGVGVSLDALARRRGRFQVMCEAVALLNMCDLPEVVRWELWVPYRGEPRAEGQLSVCYSDTEARRAVAGMLAYLTDGRITEQRSHDDAHTMVHAEGSFRGLPVRVWTHVDHRNPVGGGRGESR